MAVGVRQIRVAYHRGRNTRLVFLTWILVALVSCYQKSHRDDSAIKDGKSADKVDASSEGGISEDDTSEGGISEGGLMDTARDTDTLCGNGFIESGEKCDDGNLENNDDCDMDCMFHDPCKDGFFDGHVAPRSPEDLLALADCIKIGGNLIIEDTDLQNLDSLQNINSIEGEFHIRYNKNLVNLNGLSSLSSVAGFMSIHTNNQLVNLEGLNQIRSIGGIFHISANENLIELDALDNLTSVGDSFSISGNASLKDITGIMSLQECSRVIIEGNDSLDTCDAESIETILLSREYVRSAVVCGNRRDECGSDTCMDPF